ncbi:MAG: hypothetical protein NTV79_00840, partial [Candidatus Aureabacteria bacterium]|nr:hypothetical protein [Candidatus Auribacterota bacterium]
CVTVMQRQHRPNNRREIYGSPVAGSPRLMHVVQASAERSPERGARSSDLWLPAIPPGFNPGEIKIWGKIGVSSLSPCPLPARSAGRGKEERGRSRCYSIFSPHRRKAGGGGQRAPSPVRAYGPSFLPAHLALRSV